MYVVKKKTGIYIQKCLPESLYQFTSLPLMKKFIYTPLASLKSIHLFILPSKSIEVWESKKRRRGNVYKIAVVHLSM